jgi:hypothetical protein
MDKQSSGKQILQTNPYIWGNQAHLAFSNFFIRPLNHGEKIGSSSDKNVVLHRRRKKIDALASLVLRHVSQSVSYSVSQGKIGLLDFWTFGL